VFLDNGWQLLDHLGAEMGSPVGFLQRRTYKEVTALLLMGEIDAAWLCGSPLLQYSDRLAVGRTMLWEKMQKLGLQRPESNVRESEQNRI